jgi:tetratricopeptide (TPR) repeat protein
MLHTPFAAMKLEDRMESRLTAAAFIAVFAIYLFLGGIGTTDRDDRDPKAEAYNLLAAGLQSGHLYLSEAAPPGLVGLPNPYDPAANAAFRTDPDLRLHDLSYYRGRLYLYFGISPALFLFLPWHLLTGAWLMHWAAVVALCFAGLLVNVSLVRSVKAAQFPGTAPWIMSACVFILGLGSYAPVLLARADLWEVPIAFGYLGVSVALRCLWEAFSRPASTAARIAIASLALGAAFAARPSVLPNAAILLLPFVFAETRRSVRAWVAAIVPLGACGALVALYNALRFGDTFQFGQIYQLAGEVVGGRRLFGMDFLLTNLRLYLFQAVSWRPIFPFATEPVIASLPAAHGQVEHISGALLNAPILWAAVAAMVFACVRRPGGRMTLLVLSASWVGLSSLIVMALFFGVCARYQFEFLPALALLAALGVMAVESEVSGSRRVIFRSLWIPALAVSSAFPVLYGIDKCVAAYNSRSLMFLVRGDALDAGREVETAKFLSPGNPESRLISGILLMRGAPAEGLEAIESLVHDFPSYAMGHYFLANELRSRGRWNDALMHFQAAHKLAPANSAIAEDLRKAEARGR